MQLLQSGRLPWLHCSTWLCIFTAIAAADIGGDWSKSLSGSTLKLAEVVLITGCTIGALSLLLLIVAVLEFTGCYYPPRFCGGFTYPIAHIVLATLWLPVIGMSAFLLNERLYSAVAFVAAGGVLTSVHLALALYQLCWCCCGGAMLSAPSDHPKSALLTPQGDRRGGPSGDSAQSVGPGVGPGVEGHNPFRATYGLLPGSSSVFAYQIFIPGTDEEMVGGSYTGLGCGPARQDGRSRRAKQGEHLVSLRSSTSAVTSAPVAAATGTGPAAGPQLQISIPRDMRM